MNLAKLFEIQMVLDAHIESKHPRQEGEDRISKKILALLVEVGECANEARFFKFWSNDQKPKTKALRMPTMMEEDKEYYNPTLEEFVDGLHFVLGLGIEIEFVSYSTLGYSPEADDLTDMFTLVYEMISRFKRYQSVFHYGILFDCYMTLGKMLGFTWEQIEVAYYEKNQINHLRQANGY
ncbi:dUTP diphosphatase [Peribacillus loiseleuriae]|uniref:dUTPase n=1 Tax=Peribacillus loiseleuriae TaxID=1679170 RepID=A0A0K9GTF6_9BACI|nr:dUTP diphosphatase [Peribacillus loiseleuriae]KMY49547.1 hypothetical protein AC625_08310 [Peribacillus loiseleuriae]